MDKAKFKQEIFAYMLLIAGSALFAVGDVMFVNPYLMAPGGTYGLSNVLNTVWPWKISLYAICMDIPFVSLANQDHVPQRLAGHVHLARSRKQLRMRCGGHLAVEPLAVDTQTVHVQRAGVVEPNLAGCRPEGQIRLGIDVRHGGCIQHLPHGHTVRQRIGALPRIRMEADKIRPGRLDLEKSRRLIEVRTPKRIAGDDMIGFGGAFRRIPEVQLAHITRHTLWIPVQVVTPRPAPIGEAVHAHVKLHRLIAARTVERAGHVVPVTARLAVWFLDRVLDIHTMGIPRPIRVVVARPVRGSAAAVAFEAAVDNKLGAKPHRHSRRILDFHELVVVRERKRPADELVEVNNHAGPLSRNRKGIRKVIGLARERVDLVRHAEVDGVPAVQLNLRLIFRQWLAATRVCSVRIRRDATVERRRPRRHAAGLHPEPPDSSREIRRRARRRVADCALRGIRVNPHEGVVAIAPEFMRPKLEIVAGGRHRHAHHRIDDRLHDRIGINADTVGKYPPGVGRSQVVAT